MDAPFDPIEEKVVAFFYSMLDQVKDSEQALVMIHSSALAISAFLVLRFEEAARVQNAKAFCQSVMQCVELGKPQ